MPASILPYLSLEVSPDLRDALRASASVLRHCISAPPSQLPESVSFVCDKYRDLVKRRTLVPLAVYAAGLHPEEYVPRAQLFDMDALFDDGLPVCRATRAPALLDPTYAGLARALDSFFEEADAGSGVAVWSTFMPPALGRLLDVDFLVLGLVRDVSGKEAAFLGSPSGLRWLAAEGAGLADLISSAMLTGSAVLLHVLNESLRQALRDGTEAELGSAVSPLATPLLSAEQAGQASERLWGRTSGPSRAIEAYFTDATQLVLSESMNILNQLSLLIEKWEEQVEAVTEAGRKQLEKEKRRARKDQEKLQQAYTGLKARADRQDLLIRELRRSATGATAGAPLAGPAPTGDQAFNNSLRELFGRP